MKQRENGIVIGTVMDLDDPEKLGRVKVRLAQYNDEQSCWARLVAPMAGKQRGFFFRPEKEDEVLIAFENGDPRRAYVLGALWSKVDAPPPDDGKKDNNWRFIVSRSGHILKLDDTSGAEKVEVIDKSGKHKIVLDASGDKIQIICDSGNVEVKAPAGSVKVDAQSIEINASADMTLTAGTQLKIQGNKVDIN
ncbi:MAG TPA: phage baseplate assembly protein V [Blastocatellia bacterium]|nr:phage baseplate assembly protein V [Blastocatellia bacterium]